MKIEEIRDFIRGIQEEQRHANPLEGIAHPKCNKCVKRTKWMCELYPNGIPKAILSDEESCPEFQNKKTEK